MPRTLRPSQICRSPFASKALSHAAPRFAALASAWHSVPHVLPKNRQRRPAMIRMVLFVGLILLMSFPSSAATFAVNSTGDAGDIMPGDGQCYTGFFTSLGNGFFGPACTLRAAIQEANGLPGHDVVEFAHTLPKVAGVVEIRPDSILPSISNPLTIDGYSAEGYDQNDPEETPIINLSGSSISPATGASHGLRFWTGGSGSRIQGLAIFGFAGDGINLPTTFPALQDIAIEGCHVGVWRGLFYEGNGGRGISVRGSQDIRIGRTCGSRACSGRPNIIATSGESGIRLFFSNNVEIAGNRIGTDRFGSSTFVPFGGSTGNQGLGIEVEGGSNIRIGRVLTGGENLISGNGLGGILVDVASTTIVNNKIGTNLAGTTALPNNGAGIRLESGSNTVGIPGAGRNLISGNDSWGIFSIGPNRIEGNVIGLSGDESFAIANDSHGILLDGSGAVVEGNILSGNRVFGLLVFGDSHQIFSNLIGTNSAFEDVRNGLHGIIVQEAHSVEVGGAGLGNTVGFNNIGIGFVSESASNSIQGNFVGTTATGQNLGNTESGITLNNSADILVGGIDGLNNGLGNVIAFNGGDGVAGGPTSPSGEDNRILGNSIGTNALGDPMGNDGSGISIWGDGYVVGAALGDSPELVAASANRIAHNTQSAVRVRNGATGATVRGNEIFANGGGATPIDLADDGPTANDIGDIDDGENYLQNYPEIIASQTEWNEITGDLEVRYRVNTNEDDAVYPLTVDFYLLTEPSGFADVYIGSDTYPADSATLYRSVAITPNPGVNVSGLLLATATDAEGNTSELSRESIPVPEPGFNLALAIGAGALAVRRRGLRGVGGIGGVRNAESRQGQGAGRIEKHAGRDHI